MFVILRLPAVRVVVRRWLRQPQVIGEMIAGVVLGPPC
jgi:Kef-type K+ transport system membrane component KefB